MIKKVIILIVLFGFTTICFSDESFTKYKELSQLMREDLVLLDKNKCDIKYDSETSDAPFGYTLDCTNRKNFITKNKNLYFELINKYDDFIKTYKDSIWEDDAYFCIVLFNLTLSIPVNNFGPIAWDELDHFFKKFGKIKIENWTKEKFRDLGSFRYFFNSNAWGQNPPKGIDKLLLNEDYMSLLILSEFNLLMLYDRKEEASDILQRRRDKINDITTEIIKTRLKNHTLDH